MITSCYFYAKDSSEVFHLGAKSLPTVRVIASHVFCLVTPLWENPQLPRSWLLCYSVWQDYYRRSPLSICPASPPHFTSSPLIPPSSPPPLSSFHPPTLARPVPPLAPSLALFSGLTAGWRDICLSDRGRGTHLHPNSDLSPPLSPSLVSPTHSQPISLTVTSRDTHTHKKRGNTIIIEFKVRLDCIFRM